MDPHHTGTCKINPFWHVSKRHPGSWSQNVTIEKRKMSKQKSILTNQIEPPNASVMCFRRSVLLRRQDADDWLNFRLSEKKPKAYLYNPGYAHREGLRTGLQQRAAQTAGPASLNGSQAVVAGLQLFLSHCLIFGSSFTPSGDFQGLSIQGRS